MNNKEKVFEEKIEPLLDHIEKICEEADIQSLCVFGLGNGEKRTTNSLYTETENKEDFSPVLEAIHQMTYYHNNNEFFNKILYLMHKALYYAGFTFDGMSERVSNIAHPEVGDMVIEVTNPAGGLNCIGKLLKIEDIPGDWTKYYLKTLDGRTVEWQNCKFYKIPVDYDPLK